MEINKLIKKHEDELVNIAEARVSDDKAGDHTFNMEYDEGEKNINQFIVELKQLKAINYTRCCTQLFCDCEKPNKRWIGEDDDMYEECFNCRKDIAK
jgi:hypothetical protein